MKLTSWLLLLCLTAVTSCSSLKKTEHSTKRGAAGSVDAADRAHAAAWKDVLYKNSGYSRSQLEVQPGSDYTRITIRAVRPGEDANALADNLQILSARRPNELGAASVKIDLRR